MLRGLFVSLLLALILPFATGCFYSGYVVEAATRPQYTPGGPPAQPLRYTLSGPYRSNNLCLFLIHADENGAAPVYLTLQEAMRDGRVVIGETGAVQQLTMFNR